MLFKFYIDTGILVEVKPATEGTIQKKRDNESFVVRDSFEGDLLFYETDYDILKSFYDSSYITLTIYIYYNNIQAFTGNLDLNGKWDLDNKTLQTKINAVDNYSTLLENKDVNVNILDINDKYKLTTNALYDKLEFSLTPFTENGGLGSLWGVVSGDNVYARIFKYVYAPDNINNYIGTAGWQLKDGEPATIIRDWVGIYPEYDDTDKKSIVLSDEPTLGQQYPDNTVELSLYTIVNYSATMSGKYFVYMSLNSSLYPLTVINYSRAREFQQVIIYIIQQCDGTITFDDTGTATDSFYYFKNNAEFQNLFISTISDFILNTDNTEKDNPATLSKITFQRIADLLYDYFHLRYYIDSSKVLRFVYFTSTFISGIAPAPHDLTSYKGVNWSIYKNKFQKDLSKQFKVLKRTGLIGSRDFLGEDVIFNNVKNKITEVITFNQFYFDVIDSILNKSRYDDNNEGFFICTADLSNSNLINTFENDTYKPVDTFNTETIAGGEQFGYTSPVTIVHSDPVRGIFVTNEFPLIDGETMTMTMTISDMSDISELTILLIKNFVDGSDYSLIDSDLPSSPTSVNYSESFTVNETTTNARIMFQINNPELTATFTDLLLTSNKLYKIRKSAGILSSLTFPNAELSLANIDETHFAGGSDNTATINGTIKTLSNSQLHNYQELDEIQMTIDDFTLFDFTKYFNTDLSNECEATQISVNTDGIVSLKLIL